MKCTLCEDGTVAGVEEAIEEGWIPNFYVGDDEYDCACPTCIEKYLIAGEDGEWELAEEFVSTFNASSSTNNMADCTFEKLKADLEAAMNHVDALQKLYRKQTGKDFVRPIRL